MLLYKHASQGCKGFENVHLIFLLLECPNGHRYVITDVSSVNENTVYI